ncbi:Calcium uptake protein 2, mitochondrial [Varanus komodoensis]|nr:Calcium uptake protein 2, mitochondrial [Varanus komodoensis]
MCDSILRKKEDDVDEEMAEKLSIRKKRFIQFASLEYEGDCYMTPRDFLFSVMFDKSRLLKKASLDPEVAASYRPVANIPFLGKVLEQVVVGQLQALLDETDYLDPFQSGFRPGYGTESALVALYDDLCRERDRGSVSLLVLDLSAAFDTIDHGILLNRLAGLGVGGTA